MVNSLMDEKILFGICEVAQSQFQHSCWAYSESVNRWIWFSASLMNQSISWPRMMCFINSVVLLNMMHLRKTFSRSQTGINFKWSVEVSKESLIVIFILDILHWEEDEVALKTPEGSLHYFDVFLGSFRNHCIHPAWRTFSSSKHWSIIVRVLLLQMNLNLITGVRHSAVTGSIGFLNGGNRIKVLDNIMYRSVLDYTWITIWGFWNPVCEYSQPWLTFLGRLWCLKSRRLHLSGTKDGSANHQRDHSPDNLDTIWEHLWIPHFWLSD